MIYKHYATFRDFEDAARFQNESVELGIDTQFDENWEYGTDDDGQWYTLFFWSKHQLDEEEERYISSGAMDWDINRCDEGDLT